MMTREEVLSEMEADYKLMNEEERAGVLFTEEGQDWSPTLLIQAVRDNTEFGQKYVKSWSQNKEARKQIDEFFAALLGGGPLPEGVEVLSLDELSLEEEDEETETDPSDQN